MDLPQALRDAIETQVIEHEPAQAALVLRNAVADLGAEEVTGGLLDAAAVALRRLVAETDEAYDQVELLDRLALDGAVPADNIDILARMLTLAGCGRRSTGSSPSSDSSARFSGRGSRRCR